MEDVLSSLPIYPGDFGVSGGFQIAPTLSRKMRHHSLGGPNRSPNITGLPKFLGKHAFLETKTSGKIRSKDQNSYL